jgi:sulfide:quinone oxidoreductase
MKARVVIAGGGVAALEAALALRELAGERVGVEIYSPRSDFVYRPYAVGKPFGSAVLKTYELPALAARCGAGFHPDSIASVDPDSRLASTYDGVSVPYDHLIVAAGASRQWPVPGATTFWGIADVGDVERVMERLRSGEVRRVAFTTPGVESWALPLYELALLAEAELSKAGVEDVELSVVTPEDTPLQVFGRGASEGVAALLEERGIRVVTRTHPVRFRDGVLETVPGEDFRFDEVISLPRLEGRAVRGVHHDPDGFVRVDEHCRVLKQDRLYAAGDVTSYPVKQGGIAAQQADTAAEAIAALAGADVDPQPFKPVLRGMLLTGRGRNWLRAEIAGGAGETVAERRALWWPPTKVAGRYLAPYLQELVEHRTAGSGGTPSGLPVDLDLEHELDAVPASDA